MMNVKNQKRLSLVQKIRLSAHTDIFTEKKSGDEGSNSFLRYNYVNLPEANIFGPFLSLKHFSDISLNLSRQGASFKYLYDYILRYDFFTKRMGIIGRNLKFSPPSC